MAIKYWSQNEMKEAREYHELAKKIDPSCEWINHNDIWFINPNIRITKKILEDNKSKITKYKDCKISVIVISYSRPEGAMRIASTAKVTARRPELVEILICTDETDPLVERYKILPELDVSIIKEHRSCDKWNYLYKKSTGDIIVMMCDDVIFESWGWDDVLRDVWPDNGLAVMYSDGSKGKELVEFPVISRSMADKLGYCAYPKLDHWGIDAWWAMMGKELNCLYYLGDVWSIRHQHYEVSNVHKRNNRKEVNMVRDYTNSVQEEGEKLKV